jgi:NADH-quinone oxidoreductase subunit L
VTEILPAEGIFSLLWVLIALPAAGALILLLGGRRTNSWGPYLGVLTVVASAVISILMLLAMMDQPSEERTVIQNVYDWVFVGSFQASFALQLDQLSIVFVLLITIVGALIHIYSLGYMSHDPDRRKFFAYLNLFVAAMLLLVLANNYLLLYVGWEGVGLASYLLIGFWQRKPTCCSCRQEGFRDQPRG